MIKRGGLPRSKKCQEENVSQIKVMVERKGKEKKATMRLQTPARVIIRNEEDLVGKVGSPDF